MTSSPSPGPDPRSYTPRHAAPEPVPAALLQRLEAAEAEIGRWQDAISNLAEPRHADPAINLIRFESATRAMAPLDQLEARLRDVLTHAGVAEPSVVTADGERPHRVRRWPPELAGVPDADLQGGDLGKLTYAQLHAFAMADHPDEVDEAGRQWQAVSRAAWQRGSQLLAALRTAPDSLCPQLTQLADEYWAFAARTDHYAKTFANAARTHREARSRLEDLGPP